MLRRMKIGTRVNVLIAVPLIALIALTAVSYVALQRASVRGDEYKQLKAAEQLRSDIVPPPASLLEAWAIVNHISVLVSSPVSDRTNAEITEAMKKLSEARGRYGVAVTYWRTQPLDQRSKAAFESGATAGQAFFSRIDNEFTTAMIVRNPEAVISAVRALEDDFNVEQVFIGESLDLVDGRINAREESTDLFVSKVVLVLISAVSVLLLICLLVAFMVRRSIVRPILSLSRQARHVANDELPDAVHAIQSQPADSPMPTIEPFVVETKDELADLSASFNSVQNSALDLAVEQAAARRQVSENLVNIARRTQNLLGRSLTSLSDMEQSERDPAMLENLFRLDHLTTRMRRNAQSLLVLAGAEQNRMWSAAIPVGDVVRAAVSEIENYGRVELGDLGTANVQGAVAPDLAHLVAELLENATMFSPPTTKVMVFGRAYPYGHQIAIVDYGIGMSNDELEAANETLRQHADFDKLSGRMLGFQVVARLATRLGVEVSLIHSAGTTGVTAIVNVPSTIFEVAGSPLSAPPVPPMMPAPVDQTPLPPPAVDQRGAELPAPASTPEPHVVAAQAAASATDSVSEELWAMTEPQPPAVEYAAVESPAVEPTSVESPVDTAVAATEQVPVTPSAINGLTKRVRGAQLPDLGTNATEALTGLERPAEEVRSSLASLQRGTDRGRQQHDG